MPEPVLLSALDPAWLDPTKQFCHPDWALIGKALETQVDEGDEAAMSQASDELARLWVRRLQAEFGPGYHLLESNSFLLLSKAAPQTAAEALRFLEQCLARISKGLPFMPKTPAYGKWPVLCLDADLFYRYLNDYMDHEDEDGEEDEDAGLGAVGGVFLNRGYGHFAMPDAEMGRYSAVLVHELTHAILHDCGLPNWLDEAIAVTIENHLIGESVYVLDREMIRRHQDYWTEPKIQKFWAGTSFWLPDEGQELSYHLAQFLFKALYQSGTTPPQKVSEFISDVSREDAGLESARKHLHLDLADILANLLGDGNWAPDPAALRALWKTEETTEPDDEG